MEIKLGQIIPRSAVVARDAIHIAVYPIECGADYLQRNDYVAVTPSGLAIKGSEENHVGIVDPFLIVGACKTERFWLFMPPGSTQNLHHVWDHPRIQDDKLVGSEPDYDDECRGCNY